MANAALSLNNDSLSGEENDDVISVKSGRTNSTSSKSNRRTHRASQADFENLRRNVSELDKRFSNVDLKLDRLMNLMDTASLARQRPQSTGMDTAVFHTVTGTTGGDTVGNSKSLEWDEDDTLSIQPGQREKSQLLGDDDSDHSNSLSLIGDHCQDSDSDDRFMKYSSKTQVIFCVTCLVKMPSRDRTRVIQA
ncbi:hypothetical protein DPMN_094331 [Dreissena polymorpha]|uniref:Uncharacterized protein n=1 Tax=Dreissena polymorpha TaxID=45954 RepID=A0A9D4L5U4_DREPO|nr:hypothetical protein DPMN_094331 [Dreissena polymorpha]